MELEQLIAWLENDEASSRPHRATRLKELLDIFSDGDDAVGFMGGSNSFAAYLEMRLAFIHGLYLSTVLLALACIEQELAGALYTRGSNASARLSLELLLEAAKSERLIDPDLVADIDELRSTRNAYAHFRPPLHPMGQIQRTIRDNLTSHELPKGDAIRALQVVAAFLVHRSSF